MVGSETPPIRKIADLKSIKKRQNAYLVKTILPVTKREVQQCYERLAMEDRSIILSLVPGFAEKYVPIEAKHDLPKPFTSFFNANFVCKSREEILSECERLLLETLSAFTPQHISSVEVVTRGQSSKSVWFSQRDGKITASQLQAVMVSNLQHPSVKLIQALCYSQSVTFRGNEATKWGTDNEKRAIQGLYNILVTTHEGLEFIDSGLFISSMAPWLAASPDGLVSCKCCGLGVIEAKCPHKHRNSTISRAVQTDPQFPLMFDEESNQYHLKKTHKYYYQIQLQMFVTERQYGIFVVYTTCDLVYVNVPFDAPLFERVLPHCKIFFCEHMLPELLAKVFTNPVNNASWNAPVTPPPTPDVTDPSQTLVANYYPCICQKITNDEIIVCCKDDCIIKQYHKKCTGLKRFMSKWTCKSCQEKQKRAKAREKTMEKKRQKENVASSVSNPVIETQTDSSSAKSITNRVLGKRQTRSVNVLDLPLNSSCSRQPLKQMNK